jgi:hypothetical protein
MAKVLTRRESSGKGLVCGIGIYEPRVLCMADSPNLKRVYRTWNSMLQRAEVKYADRYPWYLGTDVDQAFHRFSDYAEWMMKQPGWDRDGWHLDKDILIKGNKTYGPDKCVFVPGAINSLLVKRSALRGDYPIGVKREKNCKTFVAVCGIDGARIRLGKFNDPVSAFKAYKAAKEEQIKRLAELFKNQIDPRTYASLLAYQVEITD